MLRVPWEFTTLLKFKMNHQKPWRLGLWLIHNDFSWNMANRKPYVSLGTPLPYLSGSHYMGGSEKPHVRYICKSSGVISHNLDAIMGHLSTKGLQPQEKCFKLEIIIMVAFSWARPPFPQLWCNLELKLTVPWVETEPWCSGRGLASVSRGLSWFG